MRLAWEVQWTGSRVEPAVTCLAWTGDGQHGLLAAGSESGVVGITSTGQLPAGSEHARHNFNLRGHHSAVCAVFWNHVQGKLASADQTGVIYVWAKNDDRWSVELVNERGVKVRDVSWSPCGTAALICYEDNFVLIGSASGQRVWSTTYPPNQPVACCVWAQDRRLVLGLSTGHLQVISDDGATLSDRQICEEEIIRLASPAVDGRVAGLTSRGRVLILREMDQPEVDMFETANIAFIQWADDGQTLAAITADGHVYLLDEHARLIHRDSVKVTSPVTAFTWAHNGNALVIACGGNIHVAKVMPNVPLLLRLVAYQVWKLTAGDLTRISHLPLPETEKQSVLSFGQHLIRCRIPYLNEFRSFATLVMDARCFCTIRPSKGKTYILCVEHMGGLVPLLVGRQVSRLLPQFHISLHPNTRKFPFAGPGAQVEDASVGLGFSSQRQSLWRRSKKRMRSLVSRKTVSIPDVRMAHISSNMCCTKFDVKGVCEGVPPFLAQVSYKTSVLHLQPRQMTVHLSDLESSSRDHIQMLEKMVGECSVLNDRILEEPAPSTSNDNSWTDEVEQLQFIDAEDEPLLCKRADVKENLEKLASIASHLADSTSDASIAILRAQMKDLIRRMDEIERKAASEDVRRELRVVMKGLERVTTAIGDSPSRKIHVLHNKTPFWNEHNQVYQLDFGGRVTQESAKNFQIEMDGKQALQFGRIEGGAYTLDFRRPFTAVQAFAIALASITQRLK